MVRYFRPEEDFLPEHWEEALGGSTGGESVGAVTRYPSRAARDEGDGLGPNRIASIYWRFTTVNLVHYITTKTALIGLTRAVALEMARTGITCNAICPGTVLTPAID